MPAPERVLRPIEPRASLSTAAFILLTLACGACKQSPAATTTTTPVAPAAFMKGPQPAGLVVTAATTGATLTLGAASGLALPLGLSKQLTATEHYSDGTSRDVTVIAQWSGSGAAGKVSSGGLVSTLAVGTSAISASIDGLTDTFSLSVEPAIASVSITTDLSGLWVGDAQPAQLVATLTDQTTLDVTGQATWTSNTAAVATVSAAGVVTGVAAGTSTITAAVDGFSATATAMVLATQPMLSAIAIGTDNNPPSSSTLSVLPTLSQSLGVWGTYSEIGAVQNVTSLGTWTWMSTNEAVATVSAGGIVKALAEGSTTISVEGHGGLSASIDVTVTAAVTSIAIAGLPASLGPGTYMFPDVIATLADSSLVDVTNWTTFTAASHHIAAVEGSAIVARNTPGSTTITATLGALTATATLNVVAISSLQIVPSTLSIPVGLTDNWIAAFATLSDGTVVEATAVITWSSSDPTIAAFGMAGATETNTPLTAVAAGTTTITAKLGTATATAPVTVTPALTVSSIALTPATSTLHFGGAQLLTANATLAGGGMQDVTPFVSWSYATAGAGLTFTSDFLAGTYAGLSPAGTDDVTAQLGTVMGSATVTVSPATISSLAVSPQNVSLSAAGMTAPLTVTATYSDSSTADVTSLAVWTSTDTAGTIVTVDQTPTSRATVVGKGAGMATLTAWISPAGPFSPGATEYSGSTTVTVQ